jgi:hypothetical protein
MDPVSLLLMVALPAIPVKPGDYDIDAPIKAAMVELNSPEMHAHIFAAMALPYKYGVSQLACQAKTMQPQRKWAPVREPSGKIEWVQGPVTKVTWSGIYGTCIIQTRREKAKLPVAERVALECECNGWLPRK